MCYVNGMGWRSTGGLGRIPAWALRFDRNELSCFIDVLDEVAMSHGMWIGVRDDSSSTFMIGPERGRVDMLLDADLHALARECRETESIHAWTGIAARHLRELAALRGLARERGGLVADFEAVRELLALRLLPASWAPWRSLVAWELGDGLWGTLVLRLPLASVPVRAAERARWPIAGEDLYWLALTNTLATAPAPRVGELSPGEGVRLRVLRGASPFTSTHALAIEQYFDSLPYCGIVMAVPCPYRVIAYGIEDAAGLDALGWLMRDAHQAFTHEPQALSPHLYWDWGNVGGLCALQYHWREDEIRRLPNTWFDGYIQARLGKVAPRSFAVRSPRGYRGYERPLPHRPRARAQSSGRHRH